jgi:PelA/Pel-15E family pectate lyase
MAHDTGQMISRRSVMAGAAVSSFVGVAGPLPAARPAVDRQAILTAMLAASKHMVEKVSRQGGYVWQTLPDGSRAWGELEASPTTVWVQNPGTPLMGQLYLDAYHASGNEYFYRAAASAADVLIRGQHPSGGWNYHFDLAGDGATRRWYDTIGKNAWRLEEFQHYYGNATFDDSCTADCAKFMLRMYMEKRETRFRPALNKAIEFVLDSQYPIGGWPQRFPHCTAWQHHGLPDYTGFITFNDDVAAENIVFLLMVWQTLGDRRMLGAIARGMDCFVRAQQQKPQPGWGLQHSVEDLKPASARTYEPKALASHSTATNVGLMMDFYELTGDRKFLARLPEAIEWLESVRLPASVDPRRRCPTFIELGSNRPLFIHRRGSNVANGIYFVDQDPRKTVAHYSSFRAIDIARLSSRYDQLVRQPGNDRTTNSLLQDQRRALPAYFTLLPVGLAELSGKLPIRLGQPAGANPLQVMKDLDAQGRWLTTLKTTSNPYVRDSSADTSDVSYPETYVGDYTDTSPYPNSEPVVGVATDVFVKNMGILIRSVAADT